MGVPLGPPQMPLNVPLALALAALSGACRGQYTPNYALRFNGTSTVLGKKLGAQEYGFNQQFISINGPQFPVFGLGNFTVEAWVKAEVPEKPDWDPAFLSNKNWATATNRGFVVAVVGSGARVKFIFNVGDQTNRATVTSLYSYAANTWQHVVGILDRRRGRIELYVNGDLTGSAPIGALQSVDSPYTYAIGQDGTGDYIYAFRGSLDDVRLWNVTRSASQIVADQGDLKHSTYGLISYFRFNEGAGNVTRDAVNRSRIGLLIHMEQSAWVRGPDLLRGTVSPEVTHSGSMSPSWSPSETSSISLPTFSPSQSPTLSTEGSISLSLSESFTPTDSAIICNRTVCNDHGCGLLLPGNTFRCVCDQSSGGYWGGGYCDSCSVGFLEGGCRALHFVLLVMRAPGGSAVTPPRMATEVAFVLNADAATVEAGKINSSSPTWDAPSLRPLLPLNGIIYYVAVGSEQMLAALQSTFVGGGTVLDANIYAILINDTAGWRALYRPSGAPPVGTVTRRWVWPVVGVLIALVSLCGAGALILLVRSLRKRKPTADVSKDPLSPSNSALFASSVHPSVIRPKATLIFPPTSLPHLTTILDTADADSSTLRESVEKARKSHSEYVARVEKMNSEIADWEAERGHLISLQELSAREIAQLQEDLNQTAAAHKSELTQLNDALQQSQITLELLRKENTRLNDESTSHLERWKSLELSCSALQVELQTTATARDRAQADVSKMVEVHDQLEKTVKKMEADLSKTHGDHKEQLYQCSSHREEIAQLNVLLDQTRGELERSAAEFRQREDALSKTCELRQREVEALRQDFVKGAEQWRLESSELQCQLEKQSSLVEELRRQHASDVDMERQFAQSDIVSVKQSFDLELSHAQEELKKAQDDVTNTHHLLITLQETLEKERDTVTSLQRDNEALVSTIHAEQEQSRLLQLSLNASRGQLEDSVERELTMERERGDHLAAEVTRLSILASNLKTEYEHQMEEESLAVRRQCSETIRQMENEMAILRQSVSTAAEVSNVKSALRDVQTSLAEARSSQNASLRIISERDERIDWLEKELVQMKQEIHSARKIAAQEKELRSSEERKAKGLQQSLDSMRRASIQDINNSPAVAKARRYSQHRLSEFNAQVEARHAEHRGSVSITDGCPFTNPEDCPFASGRVDGICHVHKPHFEDMRHQLAL